MKTYIVYILDEFELPVYISDTLKDCAQWLGVPSETIRTALKRHNRYRGKKHGVEAIQVEQELPKVKTRDALRIEIINEVCKGFDTPQIPEEPTWCGATRNQWAELYESASSDSERVDLDSDNELPW